MSSPTGIESKVLDNFRTMLSECEAFQEFVDVESAEDAIDLIFPVREDLHEFPCAVIDFEDFSRVSVAIGMSRQEGTIRLALMREIEEEEGEGDEGPTFPSDAEAAYAIMDAAGEIVEDLEELSAGGGYLNITRIVRDGLPVRTSQDEADTAAGDVYIVYYLLDYWSA